MTKLTTITSARRSPETVSPPKAPRTRKAAMTEAEIGRYLRAAHAAGYTVYAIEFHEGKLRLQTKPGVETPTAAASEAEDWLRRHG